MASLLQACGGGSNTPSTNTSQGEGLLTVSQALRGTVLTTANAPVPGAQVRWRNQTVTTDAQGHFQFDAAGSTDDALQVTHAGHAPGVHKLAGSAADHVVVVLTPHGVQQTLNAATGGDVVDTSSGARVHLPADGMVLHGSKQAASGNVTVTLTSIDPATSPGAMPGSYLVRSADGEVVPIESYGALHVSLTDAQGRRLDMAPGKKAVIRIPVTSRSAMPPATIPLLHLDEATGIWSFEGEAELKGRAPAWYYEGSVSHFTYWNADITLDTVYVSSCLVDGNGQPVAQQVLYSEGLDYTGIGTVTTDSQGRFRLPLRRGSRAMLSVQGNNYIDAVLGPHASDAAIEACYRLNPAPNNLTLVHQPEDATSVNGMARFVVKPAGAGPFKYQWQRNGVDIPPATGPTLTMWAVDAADGDKFRVVVRQGLNEVISREAVLHIAAESPPVVLGTARWVYVKAGELLSLSVDARGSGSLTYQWSFSGQAIAGATGPSLSIHGFTAHNQGEYHVVVSNRAGSVESDPWTVSLQASGSEGSGNAPTSELVRDVLSQLLNARELAYFATAGLADSDGTINLVPSPQDICTRGSGAWSLDGTPVIQMRALRPDTTHALIMSFNQCGLDDEELYNGSISLVQRISELLSTGRRTSLHSTFSNFSVGLGGALFNGRIDVDTDSTTTQNSHLTSKTIEPQPGFSVRLPNNSAVLVFTGGRVLISEDARFTQQEGVTTLRESQSYDNLSLTSSGSAFYATGSLTSTRSGSTNEATQTHAGEVVLQSAGPQVGRVFADTQGRLMVDIGGVISPFPGR
ncbi:hypothetical protein EIP75_14105 [Aquabacterium soli]|uniref:Ig-like domain-containing protein n=1 Tax=Aquabacterium soli TaxID=2493092 RepID=A0A3R8T152_9BURK|nr:carboxypeptidase regulatory-like domain-containing protein [Aquabacterium soli]RRS03718.1 hypothetical protein EIP75_14105 [Aquabacterium soli]